MNFRLSMYRVMWAKILCMAIMLNACQSTPSDPVQRLYNDNQNAQQVCVRQQAMQNGMDKHYTQPNQAAAQRANASPIAPQNRH